MKTVQYLLLAIILILLSCEVPPSAEKKDGPENNIAPLNESGNGFEGEWTWLETVGEGIAGPYRKDSITSGYSWKLLFYDSEVGGGRITSYKNGEEETSCSYTYTESDNPREQQLIIGCNNWLNENRWDSYRWEIRLIDERMHLFLRNLEDCCDNTFEHHLLLTRGPGL